MSKVRILFSIGQGLIETQARVGSKLANTIRKEGLAKIDFSECLYKLECGKCIVSCSDGVLGQPGPDEELLLSQKGAQLNHRCACQVIVSEDFKDKVIKLL
jgi:ferredoxin